MAEAKQYFKDFLSNIRLSKYQMEDLARGHNTLRDRLKSDDELSKIVQTTFLQGSYKRSTAVKPKNGKRSDVDIIVVTNIDAEKVTPQEAMNLFVPFLNKHYKDKWEFNSRSIGIKLSYVDLDLVVTAEIKDDEALNFMQREEGITTGSISKALENNLILVDYFNIFDSIFLNANKKANPDVLLIPDRETKTWEETNPLAQINWTIDKNSTCNKHYVNVVKALKWWKKLNTSPKYPKGYPLEHLIGVTCPDGIESVAEGVVSVLENIVNEYSQKPILKDHGVPDHDVFERISDEDYNEFYKLVEKAAKQARKALNEEEFSTSIEYWRELFGNEFPEPQNPSNQKSNFSERSAATKNIGSARFG